MQVQIQVNDVFLVPDGGEGRYTEWHVLDIQNGDTPLLKVDPTYGSKRWMKASEFQNMKPVKFGRYEERGFWWFKRLVLVRE